MGKLGNHFFVVLLKRLMSVKKFIVNFLKLSILFFEFIELFVDQSGLSCSEFLLILVGLEVDEMVSFNNFGYKLHE